MIPLIRRFLRRLGLIPPPIQVGEVVQLSVMSADRHPNAQPSQAIFNVTNPILIRSMLGEIDFRNEVDFRGLLAQNDAHVFAKKRNGSIDHFLLMANFRFFYQSGKKDISFVMSANGQTIWDQETLR